MDSPIPSSTNAGAGRRVGSEALGDASGELSAVDSDGLERRCSDGFLVARERGNADRLEDGVCCDAGAVVFLSFWALFARPFEEEAGFGDAWLVDCRAARRV